jgi:hypothetical protein
MKDLDNRLDHALDEALEMTFPASDPIAVSGTGAESEDEG